MAIFAQEARKALFEMPVRQPVRLRQLNKRRAWEDRGRTKETTRWLHEVHGDPITGRDRREYQREMLADQEAEEDALGLGEVSEADAGPELEVVIDDPVAHGMPRAYLKGLSGTHFSAAGQFTRNGYVVTRWEVHGVHAGEMLGVGATNRDVTVHGLTVLKFEDEGSGDERVMRCRDEWTYWDVPGLMEQIGASL